MTETTATTALLPPPGIESTRLGFGCASLMRITSAKERQALFAAAFDHGIRHFDTARMYGLGAAEGELGKFAKGRRSELTIATKFGLNPAGGLGPLARLQAPARALMNRFPALRQAVKRRGDTLVAPVRYDAEAARVSLDKSLLELGTDYVDFFFLHAPTARDEVDAELLVAFLQEARTAGKIRAFGASVETPEDAAVMARLGDDAILQVRSSVFARPETTSPHLSFGVLGTPYEQLSAYLTGSPAAATRWSEALGLDVLAGGRLAALMISDSLAANPQGTVVYSSNRAERLPAAGAVARAPFSDELLATFRTLVDADRAAIGA